MSSVGSLSSSTSSSIFNSSNRITGLASGLDTDALIESMTAATRSKIAKQNQNKQLLQWKMDDYRSISSKLIDFQNKYLSYSSTTNLRSPNFFDKTLLSVIGDNSKYVSVSGTSKTVENISIAGVKQLAQNASYTSKVNVSDQTLNGSSVSNNDKFISSELDGTYITFSYGNKNYTISVSDLKTSDELESGEDYTTIANDLVNKLNEKLNELDFGEGEKLSEVISFEFNSDTNPNKITLKETAGNAMEIKGGSSKLLNVLGLEKGDKLSKSEISSDEITDKTFAEITKTFEEMVSGDGKTISFTYNGTTKSIELPGKDSDIFDEQGNADMEKLADYLETQLDKAFGSGRIDVNFNGKKNTDGSFTGSFEFKTMLLEKNADGTYKEDTSSVLKINSGNADALETLGLTAGDSNRVNLDASVAESGLKDIDISKISNTTNDTNITDAEKKNQYVILIQNNITGGDPIAISKTVDGKDFDENTSLSDIIKAINASDANVQVTYSETSDKFTLTSKESGASGDFSIVGGYLDKDGNIIGSEEENNNLGTAIFGRTGNDNYNKTEGKDAVILVDYDGTGGADPVLITRSSNTFDIDGLSVTVNGIFGNVQTNTDDAGVTTVTSYDKDAAVTFGAKVDTEKVTEAVKAMVDAFNEIIKLTNDELSEKKNRDYAPLTDEQKEEMTEDQIKAWEEKAKAGMLFNDSDLRNFTSSIRFIFSGDSETTQLLSDMGITTSTTYSDHGKINFDETKFKAALESNPDAISDLFTRAGETTVDSEGNKITKNAGLMNQIKTIFDKYASTTGAVKGIFVQMAGATESPLSMLDNSILDQMNDIDDEIEKLQDKLETETERYYKQFTSLETFISQMNSQSSWLTSQFSS